MGFFDDEAGGGSSRFVKFDARNGNYSTRDSDKPLNDQEFVVDAGNARGGFIRWTDGRPERHLAPIFPRDEAPQRSTLPDANPAQWRPGKFSNGQPEDPFKATVELPLRHRETGETFTLTVSNKAAMAAVRDLLGECRKLPDGTLPIVRLGTTSVQTKFGVFKKPNLSVIATTGADAADFNDDMPF